MVEAVVDSLCKITLLRFIIAKLYFFFRERTSKNHLSCLVREFPSSTCFNFFSFCAALISFKYPGSGALRERGVWGRGEGGKMNLPSNSILSAELLSRVVYAK